MLVTRMLRDSRIAARDAAAMPFPREETTPPVTKTYFAIYPARVGMEKFTGMSLAVHPRRAADRIMAGARRSRMVTRSWLVALVAAIFAGAALAEDAAFPSRPVRIYGQGAGSTADYLSRYLAQKLHERWGQPVVVDSKSGAGGTVPADAVAKS